MNDFKCVFAEPLIEVGFQSTNITGTEGDCVSICIIIIRGLGVEPDLHIQLMITDITTSMLSFLVIQVFHNLHLSTFLFHSNISLSPSCSASLSRSYMYVRMWQI